MGVAWWERGNQLDSICNGLVCTGKSSWSTEQASAGDHNTSCSNSDDTMYNTCTQFINMYMYIVHTQYLQ